MNVHPALEPFPMLGEIDLARLATDVKSNGLVNPIVRQEGMILDGRARIVACDRAQVKARFVDYAGDPVLFVLRANGGRNMSYGERVTTAALLYRAGAASVSGETRVSPETDVARPDRTAAILEHWGVSRATLFRTVRLADDEDLFRAVRSGELRVNEAFRQLPRHEPANDSRKAPTPDAESLREVRRAARLARKIEEITDELRDVCKDRGARGFVQTRLESLVPILYAIADGSAYASEEHA
jgi:hypothetical protein